MSVQIENTPSGEHEDNWQPRAELLKAMRKIATIAEGDKTAVITDREINFQNGVTRSVIRASKVDLLTLDGHRISERIEVRTKLSEVLDDMTAEEITLTNTMATTYAIVRDPDEDGVALVSSLPVFEADTAVLADLYPLVVANGALDQIAGLNAAMQPTSGMGLPASDATSHWGEEEFADAQTRHRQAGIYCNAGESSLTAEFPWEEGASSAMLGEATGLIRLQSDMPHPVAGNGLFFRLDLPINLDWEELVDCVNYLNLYEAKGVDTPPFFGAWCSLLNNDTLTYAGFWPNFMFMRITIEYCSLVRGQELDRAAGAWESTVWSVSSAEKRQLCAFCQRQDGSR